MLAAALNNPVIFNLSQSILRVGEVRRYFADNYVRSSDSSHVLDVGCGTGDLLPYIPAARYDGFDCEASHVALAQKNHGSRGNFSVGDIVSIQLPEKSYDIVFAAGVLHHLSDDQARAFFKLAKRVLKPGGRVCSFDMCDRQAGFFPNLMNRIDRGKFIRQESQYLALAQETFSDIRHYDFCGKLLIPTTHCVMVCTNS